MDLHVRLHLRAREGGWTPKEQKGGSWDWTHPDHPALLLRTWKTPKGSWNMYDTQRIKGGHVSYARGMNYSNVDLAMRRHRGDFNPKTESMDATQLKLRSAMPVALMHRVASAHNYAHIGQNAWRHRASMNFLDIWGDGTWGHRDLHSGSTWEHHTSGYGHHELKQHLDKVHGKVDVSLPDFDDLGAQEAVKEGVADDIRAALPMALVKQVLHTHGWQGARDMAGMDTGRNFYHPKRQGHEMYVYPNGDWAHYQPTDTFTIAKRHSGHEELRKHLTSLPQTEAVADDIRAAVPKAKMLRTLDTQGFQHVPMVQAMQGVAPGEYWIHPEHGAVRLTDNGEWHHVCHKAGYGNLRGRTTAEFKRHLSGQHGTKSEGAEEIRKALPKALVHRKLAQAGFEPHVDREVSWSMWHKAPGGHVFTVYHDGSWMHDHYSYPGVSKRIGTGKGHKELGWALNRHGLGEWAGASDNALGTTGTKPTGEEERAALKAKMDKAKEKRLAANNGGTSPTGHGTTSATEDTKSGWAKNTTELHLKLRELGWTPEPYELNQRHRWVWRHKDLPDESVHTEQSGKWWHMTAIKPKENAQMKDAATRVQERIGNTSLLTELIIQSGADWGILTELSFSKESLSNSLKNLDVHTASRWIALAGGHHKLHSLVTGLARNYGIDVPQSALDTMKHASRGWVKAAKSHQIKYYKKEEGRESVPFVEAAPFHYRADAVIKGMGWKPMDNGRPGGAGWDYSHPELFSHVLSVYSRNWTHTSPTGKLVHGDNTKRLKNYLDILHRSGGDFSKLKKVEGVEAIDTAGMMHLHLREKGWIPRLKHADQALGPKNEWVWHLPGHQGHRIRTTSDGGWRHRWYPGKDYPGLAYEKHGRGEGAGSLRGHLEDFHSSLSEALSHDQQTDFYRKAHDELQKRGWERYGDNHRIYKKEWPTATGHLHHTINVFAEGREGGRWLHQTHESLGSGRLRVAAPYVKSSGLRRLGVYLDLLDHTNGDIASFKDTLPQTEALGRRAHLHLGLRERGWVPSHNDDISTDWEHQDQPNHMVRTYNFVRASWECHKLLQLGTGERSYGSFCERGDGWKQLRAHLHPEVEEGMWDRIKTAFSPQDPSTPDPEALVHKRDIRIIQRTHGLAVRDNWARNQGYKTLDQLTTRTEKDTKTAHPMGRIATQQRSTGAFQGGSGMGAGTRIQFRMPPISKAHHADMGTWRRLQNHVHYIVNAGPVNIRLQSVDGQHHATLNREDWGTAHVEVHPGIGLGSTSPQMQPSKRKLTSREIALRKKKGLAVESARSYAHTHVQHHINLRKLGWVPDTNRTGNFTGMTVYQWKHPEYPGHTVQTRSDGHWAVSLTKRDSVMGYDYGHAHTSGIGRGLYTALKHVAANAYVPKKDNQQSPLATERPT